MLINKLTRHAVATATVGRVYNELWQSQNWTDTPRTCLPLYSVFHSVYVIAVSLDLALTIAVINASNEH